MALDLIEDINKLSKVVDMTYVENIVMPLLNFEEQVEFAIDIWDSEDKVWVADPRKLSAKISKLKDLITTQKENNEYIS